MLRIVTAVLVVSSLAAIEAWPEWGNVDPGTVSLKQGGDDGGLALKMGDDDGRIALKMGDDEVRAA